MQDEEYLLSTEDGPDKVKMPSIVKSTAKMSVATALSRLTGFLRNMVLAYALGSGALSDTFFTANAMPNIIFELIVGGILGSVIIPVYVQYLQDKSDDEARYMINNLTTIICVIGAVASLIGAIFAPFFVHLITIREPSRATPMMIMFFRVFAFQILFYAITAMFSGILSSHRRFTMPMAAPIFNNAVVIAKILGLYLPLSRGNHGLALFLLALGTTVGVAALALVQVPSVLKAGVSLRPYFNLRHPAVKQVVKLGLPMIGFAATWQLNNAVIYVLLQPYKGGAMAYMQALVFFQLPYAIFTLSIMTAIFPELSHFANKKDFVSFKGTLSLGLRSTSFVMIPSAVFIGIMAKPIITLTLQHGRFDAAGTQITAAVLGSFAFALLSMSFYSMLTRVYYSLQDTKTPMMIGAVSVPLQIAFNFLFIAVFGVRGLPLSYALALTFAVVIQLYVLRRKIGPIGATGMVKAMGKHLTAAIPAGLIIYFIHHTAQSAMPSHMVGQIVEIIAAAAMGAITYVGLALLLRVQEVDFIKQLPQRFLRTRVNPT